VLHSGHPLGKLLQSTQFHARALAASAGIVALALIVCLAIHYGPYARASVAGPLASNAVRSPTETNWRQSPASILGSPGKNSVTLDPCPPGVIASEPWYYVYISGTGTPEAVRVTGGTCRGDSRPGTLEFTTTSSHPAGYEIESASGGIQEASIAARFTPTNPTGISQSGRVVIPPGEYDVLAPIDIRASGQTIDFGGSVLNCYTPNDACVFVGDRGQSSLFSDITLLNPRGRPMMNAGTKPFVETNAQQTRIFSLTTRQPLPKASFGTLVQVDDDQSFLLDGLDSALGGHSVTCNATYCGAYITAPGPFNKWSAVGWIKHVTLSLQCGGKGVEWLSGNGLKISDSVIQGWSVYGVRVSSHRGGYGGFVSDNVYYEAAPSCLGDNPMGNVGSGGILAEGVHVKISGLATNGVSGVFPNWGEKTGPHDWLYWVVPVHANFGDGVPLPAGHALTSGSGSVTGTFPKIMGASGYKILRMDWDQKSTRPYPEGTGNYLVATVQQSSCATQTCRFTDRGGDPKSYTNVGENMSLNIYMPRLDFWPGAVVISSKDDQSGATYQDFSPPLQADALGTGAIVSTIPSGAVTGVAHALILTGATPPAAANLEALETNAAGAIPAATVLRGADGLQTPEDGMKGRLNFGPHGRNASFTPLVTLGDSNWGKTWATGNHRPPADVNDLDLGYEGTIDNFYSRAQHEIREYVGKLPDQKPQEKLTASAKTFNVPVTINGDLTVSGKCAGCGGSSTAPRNSVSLSGQAASIASRSICGSASCTAGQYRVAYYLDAAGSCSSPGNSAVALSVAWKDEAAMRTLKVPLTGAGISSGNSLSLGASSNFGTGEIFIWSAGDAAITYSTSYTACSMGSGTYGLRIVAEKMQ
jgi:hypothetical protein